MSINQRSQIFRTLNCREYVLRMLSLTNINIRDFFKRIANSASLNEDEKNEHKSKKIQRENQCADSIFVNVFNNFNKTLSW